MIDVSVSKVAYSAFFNTQLDWVLRHAGIHTVAVCGIVTNGGVATSLLTALHRTRTVLAAVLGQFAIKAALSLVLIPRMGFVGAAAASVAAEGAGTLVLLVVASRYLAAREAGERGSRV